MPIISETEINQARKMIYEMAGIHLPSNKDSTIKNRLEKLARDLKIENFNDFFIQLKAGRFKQDFINSFTTFEQYFIYFVSISLVKNLVYLIPQSILLFILIKALMPVFLRSRMIDEKIASHVTLF